MEPMYVNTEHSETAANNDAGDLQTPNLPKEEFTSYARAELGEALSEAHSEALSEAHLARRSTAARRCPSLASHSRADAPPRHAAHAHLARAPARSRST